MAKASSLQGRQELAVTIALAGLNLAVSDEPVQPTERQIERRERREAAKQFEAALAGKSDADGGACVAEPVKPNKPPSIYNQRRSKLSPEDLERVRRLTNERMARYRAKVKGQEGR